MRSQLYLITGFLGAGKTTFLKKLVSQLRDKRLHVIVNEFGREGVDGALLSEIGAALDEISNGSIFCSCRLDRFEEVLDAALDSKPDCILVEASGLSDPTNVRNIMLQPDFADRVEYMGGICLIDAVRFEREYATARCCKKQLAASELILLNKTDLVSEEDLVRIEKQIHTQRPDLPIHRTVRAEFELSWLPRPDAEAPLFPQEDNSPDTTLMRHTLAVKPACTYDQLKRALRMIGEDSYRIKGFVELQEGLYLADCVGTLLYLEPYSGKTDGVGHLQILAGDMTVRRSIKAALQQYPEVLKLLH